MSKTKFTLQDDLFRALIKELRRSAGLTQAQLASRLGRPQSYVSKYEAGERRLDFVETSLICDALDVGIEDFAKAFSGKLGRRRRTKGS